MKKLTISISIILMLLIIVCVGFGFFDFLGNPETFDNNPDSAFVIGFNSEFPPFGYVSDNATYTGFDIELAQEVAKRNNWTFKAQPLINWNTKKVSLDSKEIDCIWSEFTINGRENDYLWTKPYFNNTKYVVVNKDSNITTLDDLNGTVLEVQKGSSILNTIAKNDTLNKTFKQINQVDGYNTAFKDMVSGNCDVIILDCCLGRYMVKEKYTNTRILNETVNTEEYGVAFAKDNHELKDQVQRTLDEMYRDGTVERIAKKYSDYGVPEGLIYPE